MFKSMTKSLEIPHFGLSEEINVTFLSNVKDLYNINLDKSNRMSYTPFFIKFLSLAISDHPIVNASVVNNDGQIQLAYHGEHNIGIAIDTPNGLVVPNIKNVQTKSIIDIQKNLKRLVDAAMKQQLSILNLKSF